MEGGSIIRHDAEMKKLIHYLKNLDFADETTIMVPGIYSKMNEIQPALGLMQLQHHESKIKIRKIITENYRKKLEGLKVKIHFFIRKRNLNE